MKNKNTSFVFTNALFKDDKYYWVLCLDLDVATQGKTPAEAKKNLLEAIELYLDYARENNLPYLRPTPASDDPRQIKMDDCVEIFDLKVA